jgi:hypothetical protein
MFFMVIPASLGGVLGGGDVFMQRSGEIVNRSSTETHRGLPMEQSGAAMSQAAVLDTWAG